MSKALILMAATIAGVFLSAEASVRRESEVADARGQDACYTKERLISVAEERLREALAAESVRLELAPTGIVEDLCGVGDTVQLKASLRGRARIRARMPVWLDVAVDGKPSRTLPVWFLVRAYKLVPVARRNLAAREAVLRGDIVFEERDIARLAGKAISSDALAHTGWLLRPVARGSVLTEADLAVPPAVKRNDSVRVTVVSGPIRVETVGVAGADGHVGDVIPIEPVSGASRYRARVTADGAVQVTGESP